MASLVCTEEHHGIAGPMLNLANQLRARISAIALNMNSSNVLRI